MEIKININDFVPICDKSNNLINDLKQLMNKHRFVEHDGNQDNDSFFFHFIDKTIKLEELQNKRNKLNREISSLKNVTLNN